MRAHAFGASYDLPIPLYLFVGGGALVVLLSFAFVVPRVVEARLGSDPAPPGSAPAAPAASAPVDVPSLAGAARRSSAVAGLAGSQEVPENILPTSSGCSPGSPSR